jgi:hypothetical protein
MQSWLGWMFCASAAHHVLLPQRSYRAAVMCHTDGHKGWCNCSGLQLLLLNLNTIVV